MPVQIDELTTRVNVVAPAAGTRTAVPAEGVAGGAAIDPGALLEMLRPLVRRILSDELEAILRERGIR